MKISICIPQYERIDYLIKSLERIALQTYDNIEVAISDDCSKDDTAERITTLKKTYRFPIQFAVNEENLGYDRNYRRCIELATGDYVIVLGNDDSLWQPDAIAFLVGFLKENGYPDIGYCNYVEEADQATVISRASQTAVIGAGIDVAIAHYNGFSFVAGLIYKKSVFDRFNTSKHDGSIYAQMYLGLLMIASGCRLFTIQEVLVLKDLRNESNTVAWSYYKNGLPRKWSEYKKMDGGLPSVANVLISAVIDARGAEDPKMAYRILKRVYGVTFPYWVIQYKKYGGLVASWGLVMGINPRKTPNWKRLSLRYKALLYQLYILMSAVSMVMPVFIFERLETRLRSSVNN